MRRLSPARRAQRDRLSAAIEEQIAPFAAAVELLCTIPGVQRRAAEVINAETGGDMTAFAAAGHLASWAGVCPGNDESAGKRRSGRTRKGSKYDDPALDELYAVIEALEDPVDPVFVREFQESTLAQAVTPDLLDTVVGESLKLPARVWHALTGPTLRADHSADLGRISVPTLVAWGDRDDIATRADQEALVDAIPGARLNVYRGGGGHAFHWEEPAAFARDLVAFVDERVAVPERSA